MTPKITHEMRSALAQSPGKPIEVEDDVSHRTYLLVDAESGRVLVEQWIREQLRAGLEAADRGEIQRFDAEAIKLAGRERRPAET